MGFIYPGVSLSQLRKRQRSMQLLDDCESLQKSQIWKSPIESNRSECSQKRVKITHKNINSHRPGIARKLEALPTELLQLIFVYSDNSQFPLTCRRINNALFSTPYLQREVLCHVVLHRLGGLRSIMERRFVTRSLIEETLEFEEVKGLLRGQRVATRLCRAPFTLSKLELLQYAVQGGASLGDPNTAIYSLAVDLYENPTPDSADVVLSTKEDIDVGNLYTSVFGHQHSTVRQRFLALLLTYSSSCTVDAETVDMLFMSRQYRLIRHGAVTGAINVFDPEIWEKVSCRGDVVALEVLVELSSGCKLEQEGGFNMRI
ncbi:uncharacterized protein V1516DRAFT_711607 [Lipomyces oligophaga]|uniref:uncharacterized protein n=1 Tax=Lipomyces oligophaga TaxID=45792 RepID=UPI0034CD44EF